MRLLFVATAAKPHLYPLVPLAWACRVAGHDVRVASAPALVPDIVHSGLSAVAAGENIRYSPQDRDDLVAAIYTQDAWPADWAVNPHLLSPEQRAYLERLGRTMIRGAEAMAEGLVEFARSYRPDLVVYDAVSYGGPVTAAVLGVPGVRHLFGTEVVPRLELTADGDPLPEYVALFERFGVEPTISAALVVDPTPPSMRLTDEKPLRDMRYVPYNGPGAVPDWVATLRPRPRACLTWGHTAPRALGRAASDPYRQVIEALGGLGTGFGIEFVVVSTPEQIELMGELPANVRTAPSTPLHLILPHCDVLIHQGGDGTTLTAAALGVPQLAISRKPDAEVPASRIAAVGAGIHLRYQELRSDPAAPDVIRAAVEKLLADTGYRDAADRLRAEIERQPPPTAIVPALSALAG